MIDENLAAVTDDDEASTSEAENEPQNEADTEAAETGADASDSEADENENKEPDASADADETPKRKSRSQRYAQRITSQAAEIAELQRKLEETQKAAPTVETPKPKVDDFETFEEYDAANAEWLLKKAFAEHDKNTAGQRQAEAAKAVTRERMQAYQARLTEAKTYIPDFDEVVGSASDVPVADHVHDLVVDSERAGDLVYHFANNPDLLADINQMSEVQVAREIGRLEASLAKPVPRKQSKAPPPVKPVRGSAVVKPLAEMSMADYAKRRTKEIYG